MASISWLRSIGPSPLFPIVGKIWILFVEGKRSDSSIKKLFCSETVLILLMIFFYDIEGAMGFHCNRDVVKKAPFRWHKKYIE